MRCVNMRGSGTLGREKKTVGCDSDISARNRKYGPRPWLRKKSGSIWSSLPLKRFSQSFVEAKNRRMAADGG